MKIFGTKIQQELAKISMEKIEIWAYIFKMFLILQLVSLDIQVYVRLKFMVIKSKRVQYNQLIQKIKAQFCTVLSFLKILF